ncbi:hypothetical protein PSAB6_160008 [Paraburkholderia sabiae]|nr:hypothetical protein PSAB6_160008 [Paraburkholderia sabiae]
MATVTGRMTTGCVITRTTMIRTTITATVRRRRVTTNALTANLAASGKDAARTNKGRPARKSAPALVVSGVGKVRSIGDKRPFSPQHKDATHERMNR